MTLNAHQRQLRIVEYASFVSLYTFLISISFVILFVSLFCLCILLFVCLNSLRMINYIKVSIENLAGVCTNCLFIFCDLVCLLRSYQYFDQSYEKNFCRRGGGSVLQSRFIQRPSHRLDPPLTFTKVLSHDLMILNKQKALALLVSSFI